MSDLKQARVLLMSAERDISALFAAWRTSLSSRTRFSAFMHNRRPKNYSRLGSLC